MAMLGRTMPTWDFHLFICFLFSLVGFYGRLMASKKGFQLMKIQQHEHSVILALRSSKKASTTKFFAKTSASRSKAKRCEQEGENSIKTMRSWKSLCCRWLTNPGTVVLTTEMISITISCVSHQIGMNCEFIYAIVRYASGNNFWLLISCRLVAVVRELFGVWGLVGGESSVERGEQCFAGFEDASERKFWLSYDTKCVEVYTVLAVDRKFHVVRLSTSSHSSFDVSSFNLKLLEVHKFSCCLGPQWCLKCFQTSMFPF